MLGTVIGAIVLTIFTSVTEAQLVEQKATGRTEDCRPRL